MSDVVTVVEFVKSGGVYRTGDKAGFEPSLAREYVNRGFARLVQDNVPRVDPGVVITDAERQIEAIRASVTKAERDAKSLGDAAAAAEVLASAQAARKAADALEAQLRAAGHIPADGARKPNAAARAA